MYAVIETGGKQIKVQEGEVVNVEKIDVPQEGKYVFQNVLLIVDGENVTVGKPFIENAKVEATPLGEGKEKKVIAFKFKRRKNRKKTKGHRQIFSKMKIDKIIK